MKKRLHTAFLGIGSNMGNRGRYIHKALLLLKQEGVSVVKASHWYETAPVGVETQRNFLNGVVKIKTDQSPQSLGRTLKKVERQLGRVRQKRWGPRVIDLDLLLFGAKRLRTPSLQIPHPRMDHRGFVLVPLSELTPLASLPEWRRRRRALP